MDHRSFLAYIKATLNLNVRVSDHTAQFQGRLLCTRKTKDVYMNMRLWTGYLSVKIHFISIRKIKRDKM